MNQLTLDVALLRALQRHAEAITCGDMSGIGQPLTEVPALEDLRRAIDVLGMHTEQHD